MENLDGGKSIALLNKTTKTIEYLFNVVVPFILLNAEESVGIFLAQSVALFKLK